MLPLRSHTVRTGACGILAGTGLLLLSACGAPSENKTSQPKATQAPPVVSVSVVSRRDEAGIIRASGPLALQRETQLAFKVGGVIESIAVDEGDRVSAGQVLARLNLTELAASTSESNAALRTAEAQLTRTRTLFERGLVAQARLDDAQLAVDRARAADQAAGFNRTRGQIVAPTAGVILRRAAEPNQIIAPGATVLVLGEARNGWVARVTVAAESAARLRLGAPAKVTIQGLDATPRDGRVARIGAKSDAATGAFDVEVTVPAAADLRSGLVAEVAITAQPAVVDADPPLRAPTLALVDARADQASVFVIDEASVARRRPVETAGIEGDQVIIVSGLAPGERVVSSGAAYIRDGQTVAIANAPVAP